MPSDHRFVAHIDILGMRAMMRRDAEVAWTVLSELANVRSYVSRLRLSDIRTAQAEMLAHRVFSVMFSDTIVLFTKTESNQDLQAILIAAAEVLHKSMFNRVPVRIGVAGGLFFFNVENSMYAGPALIEAYELGESAQWLGITTTASVCAQACAASFKTGSEDIVVPATIPTKKGVLPGHAMNWVAAYRHDFKVPPPISVEQFYAQFEQAFGPLNELPERERQKYVNTTAFINERLAGT